MSRYIHDKPVKAKKAADVNSSLDDEKYFNEDFEFG